MKKFFRTEYSNGSARAGPGVLFVIIDSLSANFTPIFFLLPPGKVVVEPV